MRLLLVALFLACAPSVVFADDPHLGPVNRLAEAEVGGYTPGLAVLVLRDGRVLHMRGYGLADLETQEPVTPDTLFDLASVSKQMTALAAMLQMEQGLYAEATPIATFLPGFAARDGDRAITVGDLIHHVSGLADYLDDGSALDYGHDTTDAEVLAWLQAQPLATAPGTVFDYSNSGYLTLGSLIAAADRVPTLADVLEARVWRPLGMVSTTIAAPADPGRAATGYAGTEGRFVPSSWPNLAQGDGNVFSSLRDLALYEAALAGNRLLGRPATARLFVPGRLDDGSPLGEDEDYAYGWSVDRHAGETIAWHDGGWAGTSTHYQRNLTTGVTIILLANGEDMALDGLAEGIAAALPQP